MSGEFTCAKCGGRFTKNRSDEETAAEAEVLFPGLGMDDPETVLVCGDCFWPMMEWAQAHAPELTGPGWLRP
jgi:hypothetical protein